MAKILSFEFTSERERLIPVGIEAHSGSGDG